MRFTSRSIEALKCRSARYEVWQDGRTGLGVRVSRSGQKSWIYMYRYDGRARRMTLGRFPVMNLADANLEHAKARKLKDLDQDPGALLMGKKRNERDSDTIEDLAEKFLHATEQKVKSTPERRRAINKDVLPFWGKRKASTITRRDVVELIDGIASRGAPIQANRMYGMIRRMFNFAIGKGILISNPCTLVELPGVERQRDRVLSEKEIKTFWDGVSTSDMAEVIQLALKFQLVTAQRKGEIVNAEKTEIEGEFWTIPAEKAKNGLAHRVPLSPLAKNIIEQAGKLDKKSKWLFPSPSSDENVTARAVDHALRKATMIKEGRERKVAIDDFKPHDLRRTGASKLTGMGIPRLTVSKILNHAESGVTAVYDRHSYDPEKKQALNAWAAELVRIIEGRPVGDNVVQMEKGG